MLCSTFPSLIEAYTYLKERKVKNKADRLRQLCEEHPQDDILALVLAHEYARHGECRASRKWKRGKA